MCMSPDELTLYVFIDQVLDLLANIIRLITCCNQGTDQMISSQVTIRHGLCSMDTGHGTPELP